MDKSNSTLITLREAQERLQIGRTQLYALCRCSAIRTVKIGKRGLRIPVAELERFIANRLEDN